MFMRTPNIWGSATRSVGPQNGSARLSRTDLCTILQASFGEHAFYDVE
jgi:hypothetical protein